MKKLLLSLLLLIPTLIYASVNPPPIIESPRNWCGVPDPTPHYYNSGGLIQFSKTGGYFGMDSVKTVYAGPFTVTFGSAWAKLVDYDAPSNQTNCGWGNFANEPSPHVVAVFGYINESSDGNIYIDPPAHYVSLWVSNWIPPFTLDAWCTGPHSDIICATVTTSEYGVSGVSEEYDANCSGDPNGIYCKWTKISLSSSSDIKYINMSGFVNYFVIDDILLGLNTTAPTPCIPPNCDME